jgi:hypothetical protein
MARSAYRCTDGPAGAAAAAATLGQHPQGLDAGHGAFDSDTATGMMPVAHRVVGVLAFRRS